MKEIRRHGDGRSFWEACRHKRKQPELRCTVNVNGLISEVEARRDSWLLRVSAADCFPNRADKTFIPTIPRAASSNRFTGFSALTTRDCHTASLICLTTGLAFIQPLTLFRAREGRQSCARPNGLFIELFFPITPRMNNLRKLKDKDHGFETRLRYRYRSTNSV